MSKTVLFTTAHLLGFSRTQASGEVLDVEKCINSREDVTIELKIGKRFEVNAIIGPHNGKPSVVFWVLDYKAAADAPSEGDIWRASIVMDEVYDCYEKAHDAIAETVDHLLTELESPTSFSDRPLAESLTQ